MVLEILHFLPNEARLVNIFYTGKINKAEFTIVIVKMFIVNGD